MHSVPTYVCAASHTALCMHSVVLHIQILLYIYIYIYIICIHVRTYVCTYICMYVYHIVSICVVNINTVLYVPMQVRMYVMCTCLPRIPVYVCFYVYCMVCIEVYVRT